MTDRDRELLLLAAKAAGHKLKFVPLAGSELPVAEDLGCSWNPLIDDGTALRLAVNLRLDLTQMTTGGGQQVLRVLGPQSIDRTYEIAEDDPYAATRRAIVRAAAELGRSS